MRNISLLLALCALSAAACGTKPAAPGADLRAPLDIPAAAPQVEVQPLDVVVVVSIKGHAFEPEHLEIRPGTTVRWINEDTHPHTATADDQEGWGTALLEKGELAEETFKAAGVHKYHCEPHPWMKAIIEVK